MTQERPAWLTGRNIYEPVGELVAGAVLMRAGGAPALLLYIAYELVVLLATLPARLCYRGPSGGDLFAPPCDYWILVANRWPLWLALGLGVLGYRLLRRRGDGKNTVLRAAGAVALCSSVASTLASLWLFLVVLPSRGGLDFGTALTTLSFPWFAVGYVIGGIAAGILLARAPFAAALLVALALIGPSYAFGVTLARGQIGIVNQPLFLALELWSWAWLPLLASLTLIVTRALLRARGNLLLARL